MLRKDDLIRKISLKAEDFYKEKDGRPVDFLHDWGHVTRVYNACLKIMEFEIKVNRIEVLVAALFHDIGRWYDQTKPHAEVSAQMTKDILLEFSKELISAGANPEKIVNLINYHATAHNCTHEICDSLELKILADADKIDMFGPVGIIRVSASYGDKNPIEKSVDQLHEEAKTDNFTLHTEGGRKVGLYYKEYLIKFNKDLNAQIEDLGTPIN